MATRRQAHRTERGRGLRLPLRGCVMLLVYLMVGYGLLVLAVYLLQYRLLYLPDTTSHQRLIVDARALELQPWPREDGDYRGFLPTKQPLRSRGTIVVFHGNAGSALDRGYYLEPLYRLGYRVILLEYPGYGARRGGLGEASLVSDGRASVSLAIAEFGHPLHVWGESLGCGVATGVAADATLGIDGLILLTPWDTLANTAQAHYWWLPARWLTRDQYDNVRNLDRFSGPVAVLLADHDEVIPKRLTMRLFESLQTTRQLWIFSEAGHNSWPTSPGESWWAEVMRFVDPISSARP